MNVILLEKVENLGNIGDRVKVRPGYGRNYLLPRGKAALATAANIALVEARRAEFERHAQEEIAAAKIRAEQLAGLTIRLTARAGTEGRLFGSVGTTDIAEACTAAGVAVKRSEVRLPEGPIRTVGDHSVDLHLHSDLNVTISVTVVGEEDTSPAA